MLALCPSLVYSRRMLEHTRDVIGRFPRTRWPLSQVAIRFQSGLTMAPRMPLQRADAAGAKRPHPLPHLRTRLSFTCGKAALYPRFVISITSKSGAIMEARQTVSRWKSYVGYYYREKGCARTYSKGAWWVEWVLMSSHSPPSMFIVLGRKPDRQTACHTNNNIQGKNIARCGVRR